MRFRPFKSFLGTPLNLPTGKVWYEEDIINAQRGFVKQFEALATVVDDKKTDGEKMVALVAEVMSLSLRLDNGRHYLMSTDREDLTVENCLEAFGYTKNGLDKLK